MKFCVDASKISLQEGMLNRLAEASNLRGQVLDLLELWVRAAAEAELFAMWASRGEEIRAAIVAQANPFALPKKPESRMIGLRKPRETKK